MRYQSRKMSRDSRTWVFWSILVHSRKKHVIKWINTVYIFVYPSRLFSWLVFLNNSTILKRTQWVLTHNFFIFVCVNPNNYFSVLAEALIKTSFPPGWQDSEQTNQHDVSLLSITKSMWCLEFIHISENNPLRICAYVFLIFNFFSS